MHMCSYIHTYALLSVLLAKIKFHGDHVNQCVILRHYKYDK